MPFVGWDFGQVISVLKTSEAQLATGTSKMRRDIDLGEKGGCFVCYESVQINSARLPMKFSRCWNVEQD